jgi:hypothetical protein
LEASVRYLGLIDSGVDAEMIFQNEMDAEVEAQSKEESEAQPEQKTDEQDISPNAHSGTPQ